MYLDSNLINKLFNLSCSKKKKLIDVSINKVHKILFLINIIQYSSFDR